MRRRLLCAKRMRNWECRREVVGHLTAMPQIVPDPLEVSRTLVVPVGSLRKPGVHGTTMREWRGTMREVHHYDVAGDQIWGATARILYNLLQVWSGETSVS